MSAALARIAADDTLDLLLPPRSGRGPEPARAPVLHRMQSIALSGQTMGTGWSLRAVVDESVEPGRIETTLERCFTCVIDQMSQWRGDSQISRFNRGAPGSRHIIGSQFRQVLDCSFEIYHASGGAFDPFLGQASTALGFGADLGGGAMAANEFPARCNGERILSGDSGSIVQPGDVTLDLSGIAKGFAVDMGIAAIERLGIAHALLDIGGELKAIGYRADGLPWWVDLPIPPGSAAPETRIGLTGWAVATSGHWERRREANGHSWSHTLDPASCAPTNDALSATVLHPGCMQADALATALIVMGIDEGLRFADRHNIPARITGPCRVSESAAWRAWKA